jgi:hypothetical protein
MQPRICQVCAYTCRRSAQCRGRWKAGGSRDAGRKDGAECTSHRLFLQRRPERARARCRPLDCSGTGNQAVRVHVQRLLLKIALFADKVDLPGGDSQRGAPFHERFLFAMNAEESTHAQAGEDRKVDDRQRDSSPVRPTA